MTHALHVRPVRFAAGIAINLAGAGVLLAGAVPLF